MAFIEVPRSPEQTRVLFEVSRTEVLAALRHPFIPGVQAEVMTRSLQAAELLSDDRFLEILHGDSVLPALPPSSGAFVHQYDQEVAGMNSYYKQADPLTSTDPRLIFREGYFRLDPFADEYGSSLLAEQIPSVAAVEKTRPLSAFGDHSLVLIPFRTKAEAVALFSRIRQEHFGIPGNIEIEDIAVHTTGFTQHYYDLSRRLHLPIVGMHVVLDDVRSAIMQTILETIIFGQRTAPTADPVKQFSLGQAILKEHMKKIPFAFTNEVAAEEFLQVFFGSSNPELTNFALEQFHRLIKDLTEKDFAEFMESQSPEDQQAFVRACQRLKR